MGTWSKPQFSYSLSTYFQGLFQRDDNQDVINIPLGIIPAGSGNGLARSLAHINKEKYDKGKGFTLSDFTLNVKPKVKCR